MGGETSSLVPKPLGFEYMCITFRTTDRIRLLYAEDRVISAVKEAILQHWLKGVQEETTKFGSAHEFKLRGNPFYIASSAENAIKARKLACNILHRLYNIGWKLLISSDLARTSDLTTWFFHKEQLQPSQYDMGCISVSSSDKLQFINFPPAVMQAFQAVVQQAWPQEIQKTKYIGDTLEIKLRGNPWRSWGGAENIQSKTLIRMLINNVSSKQWGLYGSANLKDTADSLFFRYDSLQPLDGSLATVFAISLNKNDRLRCIDAPAGVSECVKKVIVDHWHRGLQKEQPKFNSHEFKLAGTPWWASGTEAIDSRMLVCRVLQGLMSIGWRVQIGLDLSRKENDKSILMFQRCAPTAAQVFCLSLNETDKIRLINAPENVVTALRGEVGRTWLFGVSRERNDQACFEMKLNKNPWSYGINGHDGLHGRVMLSYLIQTCAQLGWFVILSADVSAKFVHQENGPDYPIDVHSMWFLYLGYGAAPPVPQPFATAPPEPSFPSALPPVQFGMQSVPPAGTAPPQSNISFQSAFSYGPST
eukprot:gene17978-19775_t